MLESVVIKNNKYDRLIITLIVLQIFGGLGGAIQPVRVFIVLLWPLLFFSNKKKWIKYLSNKGLLFYVFWICYSIFSLLWVTSKSLAIKSILYNIVHFSIFPLLFLLASRANTPLKSIIKGWCLFFVLTIPFALFEFATGIHLPSAHKGAELYIQGGQTRMFAAINFTNLNSYNLLLVYSLPFLFVNYINGTKNGTKIRATILIVVASCFIILNSSRAALLCLIIIFLYFIISFRKKLGNGFKFIIFLSIIAGGFMFNIIFKNISSRINAKKGDLLGDSYREEILNKGFEIVQETFFIGVGPGNFALLIDESTNFSVVHDYIASHNFFLEILVEYGIIILVLFISYLYGIYKKRKINNISNFVIGSSILFYGISCVINSSYILSTPTWIFIFSLNMFALFDFNHPTNLLNSKK